MTKNGQNQQVNLLQLKPNGLGFIIGSSLGRKQKWRLLRIDEVLMNMCVIVFRLKNDFCLFVSMCVNSTSMSARLLCVFPHLSLNLHHIYWYNCVVYSSFL